MLNCWCITWPVGFKRLIFNEADCSVLRKTFRPLIKIFPGKEPGQNVKVLRFRQWLRPYLEGVAGGLVQTRAISNTVKTGKGGQSLKRWRTSTRRRGCLPGEDFIDARGGFYWCPGKILLMPGEDFIDARGRFYWSLSPRKLQDVSFKHFRLQGLQKCPLSFQVLLVYHEGRTESHEQQFFVK